MVKILISAVLIGHTSFVYGAWFGPDNYEDCILEAIPKAKTDLAVKEVRSACRNKFPPKVRLTTPESNNNRSGDYVCQQILGNEIYQVVVNETEQTLFINEREHKISGTTESKIYTEKFSNEAASDIYFIFETTYGGVRNHLELRWKASKTGQDESVRFRCEESS